jgi:hypothetical protein
VIRRHDDYAYRGERHHRRHYRHGHHHRHGFCPPGQARKGRC